MILTLTRYPPIFPDLQSGAEYAGIITHEGIYTKPEHGHARKHPIWHLTPFPLSRWFHAFLDLGWNATPVPL